jgi:hypothetical protein
MDDMTKKNLRAAFCTLISLMTGHALYRKRWGTFNSQYAQRAGQSDPELSRLMVQAHAAQEAVDAYIIAKTETTTHKVSNSATGDAYSAHTVRR